MGGARVYGDQDFIKALAMHAFMQNEAVSELAGDEDKELLEVDESPRFSARETLKTKHSADIHAFHI